MIYLFLGADDAAKDQKIAQMKAALFKDPQALLFDLDMLDAQGLTAQSLKKALMTLPVMSSKRLVIVRQAQKLKTDDIQSLIQTVSGGIKHADIILNAPEVPAKGEWKQLTALCQTLTFGVAASRNVFDMTKLISSRQAAAALKMLHEFYGDNVHPLQIMGALVWYWSREGSALGAVKYEQGLRALQAADLNMKRSRFDSHYALEKVIVELVQLRSV